MRLIVDFGVVVVQFVLLLRLAIFQPFLVRGSCIIYSYRLTFGLFHGSLRLIIFSVEAMAVTEVLFRSGIWSVSVFFEDRIIWLANFGNSVIFWLFAIYLVLVDWWLKLVLSIN